jgi:hypothetical protein
MPLSYLSMINRYYRVIDGCEIGTALSKLTKAALKNARLPLYYNNNCKQVL